MMWVMFGPNKIEVKKTIYIHVYIYIYIYMDHGQNGDGFLCAETAVEPRKKTLTTFHYTGWLTGILIMVYYNPYIIG